MTNFKKAYEAAKKAGTGAKVTPKFIKFENDGQVIVGRYVGVSEVQSSQNDGKYNMYLVDSDEGLVKFSLGAATDKEVEPSLIPGNVYAFEYSGKEELAGGKRVNRFLVTDITKSVSEEPKPASKPKPQTNSK